MTTQYTPHSSSTFVCSCCRLAGYLYQMSVSLILDDVDMESNPGKLVAALEPRIPVLEVALEGYIHQKCFLQGNSKGKPPASHQPLPAPKGRGKGKSTSRARGKGKGRGKGTVARPPSSASYAGSAGRNIRPRTTNMSQGTMGRNVRQRQLQNEQHGQQTHETRYERATQDLLNEFDQAWEEN